MGVDMNNKNYRVNRYRTFPQLSDNYKDKTPQEKKPLFLKKLERYHNVFIDINLDDLNDALVKYIGRLEYVDDVEDIGDLENRGELEDIAFFEDMDVD